MGLKLYQVTLGSEPEYVYAYSLSQALDRAYNTLGGGITGIALYDDRGDYDNMGSEELMENIRHIKETF